MIYVIGTGYVGLITGLGLAKGTQEKICFVEQDAAKLAALKAGVLTFYEPGLPELWSEVSASRNLQFRQSIESLDIKDDSLFFVCVGTPQSDNGKADLRHVDGVAASLRAKLVKASGNHLVILKSTVPPRTTDRLAETYFRDLKHVHMAMNPEFLREGCAVQDFLQPDRIILGVHDEASWERLRALYSFAHPVPIERCRPSEAELTKYASNALLATLVSFSNEVSLLSGALEVADPIRVTELLLLDRRWRVNGKLCDLSAYLKPGCGFGGSCFPKDLAALSHWSKIDSVPTPIIDGATVTNHNIQKALYDGVRRELGDKPANFTITILGLAFKAETDDTRESVGLTLVRRLLADGYRLKVHDYKAVLPPDLVGKLGLVQTKTVEEALEGSDCAVLTTVWAAYRTLEEKLFLDRMAQPLIVDGRGAWTASKFSRSRYLGTPFLAVQGAISTRKAA